MTTVKIFVVRKMFTYAKFQKYKYHYHHYAQCHQPSSFNIQITGTNCVNGITNQDPFFKTFANQPPVFTISFHLREIPL